MKDLYYYQMQAERCVSMREISRLRTIVIEFDKLFEDEMNNLIQKLVSGKIAQEELNKELSRMKEFKSFLEEKLILLESEFNLNDYKLSNQDKKEIYHLYHSGRHSQDDLKVMFGVSQPYISKIVNDHKKYGLTSK